MQECGGAPRLCKFCKSALARYTCPRCHFGYCSVKCYKDARHRGCSEDFYKDWVHACLHTEQSSAETRQKMVDTLKAAQAEAKGGDEHETDEMAELVQRLEQTDIDVRTAWNYLTENEKQEFENLIESGDVGKIVPVWKPWWEQVSLVTEVTADSGQTGCCSVQPLSELTSRAPAACVVNSVLNVLCSYIHVVRLYNGEMILQSADDLLATSTVLADDTVFCTAAEAIQAVVQRVITQSVATSEELVSLLNAVRRFLASPKLQVHLMRALEETRSALEAAAKVRGCERELKTRLRHATKKVEYMISWTAEYGAKLLSCISDVDIEAATVAMDMATFEENRKRIEEQKKTAKPRVPIEELN